MNETNNKIIWGMHRAKWSELTDLQKEEHIKKQVQQYAYVCLFEEELAKRRGWKTDKFIDCYPHIKKTQMDQHLPSVKLRTVHVPEGLL